MAGYIKSPTPVYVAGKPGEWLDIDWSLHGRQIIDVNPDNYSAGIAALKGEGARLGRDVNVLPSPNRHEIHVVVL